MLWVSIVAPQSVELIKRMERIQRRASNFILDLPFICDDSYCKRLHLLDLIPLCYWHEFLDLRFYCICVTGIITVNDNILPSIQSKERATRSTDADCLKFITPKCKTATYLKSFMSRCARVWNILPKEVTKKNISIGRFKCELYKYYKSAFNTYDAENPRTWKSVCLTFNTSRNLSDSKQCCY